MIGKLILPPQVHQGLHDGQGIRTVTYSGTCTTYDTVQDIPLPLGHHPMGIQTTMPVGGTMFSTQSAAYALAYQSCDRILQTLHGQSPDVTIRGWIHTSYTFDTTGPK